MLPLEKQVHGVFGLDKEISVIKEDLQEHWDAEGGVFYFLMFWKLPGENIHEKTLSLFLRSNSKHLLCTPAFSLRAGEGSFL